MKVIITLICAIMWMDVQASPIITADEYIAFSEGLSSIHGDAMWGTFDYAGINTVNLSYNAFTNTSLAALDFRETNAFVGVPAYDPPTINGSAYEPMIHHLDLSYNLITDASLEFFLLEIISIISGVNVIRKWHLKTLDLSYNKITNMLNFPTKKHRGDLEILNLEHNLIIHIGSPEPTALYAITIDSPTTPPHLEVNFEYNQLIEMPWLGFTGADTGGVTNSIINVKNNHILMVDLPGACSNECGYWYLKEVNFENNELTEFTKEMIIYNYDTEIMILNNNKINQIFSPWSYDSGAWYNLRELYLNNNEISSLDSGAFDFFDNLQILEMANNKITSLPFNDLFDTSKLTSLSSTNLMNNELTSIDDCTSDFPRGPSPAVVINLKGN